MDPLRLVVVVALVGLVGLVAAGYRRSRRADADRGAGGMPPLPARWRAGAEATWLIFTTPWCASCDTVEADLRRAFPAHHVVKVDATEQPELAETYRVRRAPTAVQAAADGRIVARVVGAEGVRAHLATA